MPGSDPLGTVGNQCEIIEDVKITQIDNCRGIFGKAQHFCLGFNPGDVRDGKAHKILVKVDVDGDGQTDEKAYVIHSREVYIAPKPEAATAAKTGGKE